MIEIPLENHNHENHNGYTAEKKKIQLRCHFGRELETRFGANCEFE